MENIRHYIQTYTKQYRIWEKSQAKFDEFDVLATSEQAVGTTLMVETKIHETYCSFQDVRIFLLPILVGVPWTHPYPYAYTHLYTSPMSIISSKW